MSGRQLNIAADSGRGSVDVVYGFSRKNTTDMSAMKRSNNWLARQIRQAKKNLREWPWYLRSVQGKKEDGKPT